MAKNKRIQVTLETSRGSLSVPMRVFRRRGIRHLKVSVDLNNEIVVNVPALVSEHKAMSFVHEQAEWICDVLDRTPQNRSLRDHLEAHPQVSGLGVSWRSVLSLGARAGFRVDEEDQQVELRHLADGACEVSLARSLRLFASQVIPARVRVLAHQVGLGYGRVMVRDQRSRWGSCSENRTLSFNWRLVLLPVELHDYIIWHELAHLTHLNHSAAYWGQLARYDPESEAHDAGITEWSSSLLRLGREAPPGIDPVPA